MSSKLYIVSMATESQASQSDGYNGAAADLSGSDDSSDSLALGDQECSSSPFHNELQGARRAGRKRSAGDQVTAESDGTPPAKNLRSEWMQCVSGRRALDSLFKY